LVDGKDPYNRFYFKKLDSILKSALNNEVISKSEYNAMAPKEKGPGKFYQIFKVHRKHNPPTLPPGHLIVSGCNSITENISLFMDYHAKHLVPEIPSYLQDTPDFLRQIEQLNETTLPDDCFPVSIDVVGLYSNIPNEEGLNCFKEELNKRKDKSVPTDFLANLLRLVLVWNIFEFDSKLFLQLMGTPMGTRVAPTFANILLQDWKLGSVTFGHQNI
jgi:hypothetical protein